MIDTPAKLDGAAAFPQGPPDWPLPDPDVRAALEAAIADGSWGKYHGPHVPRLESKLSEFFGVPHVLTCASGTLAVEAALHALKVQPGDEVIQPDYDYEANFLNLHAIGAKPVLVDVSGENACLDPDTLATCPTAKAIIVSHLHGGLAPMKRIREFADRSGIPVIEDAAQGCGATIEGKKAGAWGDIGILSFGGSKLLSAGRGGALLIQKQDVYQRAKVWLSRGVQQWAALSELQATALLPQLAKLTERTTHRRLQVELLANLLQSVPGLRLFQNTVAESEPAFYKVGFWYDEAAFGLNREMFVKALRADGIAFDEGFRALHVGRAAHRFRAAGPLPNAEAAHRSVVMLHHPILSLTSDAIEKVALAIGKAYRNSQSIRER
jgi:dTDP-4-amino-4,6-dideoxygalactose transaminase